MFSHIMLGANDITKSQEFYDATLRELGHHPATLDKKGRPWWRTSLGVLALSLPINGKSACHGNGSTIGFEAEDSESVDTWYAAGLKHFGTKCEDEPGIREGSTGPMYMAYLRDPAGNKVCALHRLKR
jgi:catechol 2,3-dioxygenase-like lactoylglutathione lyase family enzyme